MATFVYIIYQEFDPVLLLICGTDPNVLLETGQ